MRTWVAQGYRCPRALRSCVHTLGKKKGKEAGKEKQGVSLAVTEMLEEKGMMFFWGGMG